jgi:hypothetical protein
MSLKSPLLKQQQQQQKKNSIFLSKKKKNEKREKEKEKKKKRKKRYPLTLKHLGTIMTGSRKKELLVNSGRATLNKFCFKNIF